MGKILVGSFAGDGAVDLAKVLENKTGAENNEAAARLPFLNAERRESCIAKVKAISRVGSMSGSTAPAGRPVLS
jgi:hypothetical protein